MRARAHLIVSSGAFFIMNFIGFGEARKIEQSNGAKCVISMRCQTVEFCVNLTFVESSLVGICVVHLFCWHFFRLFGAAAVYLSMEFYAATWAFRRILTEENSDWEIWAEWIISDNMSWREVGVEVMVHRHQWKLFYRSDDFVLFAYSPDRRCHQINDFGQKLHLNKKKNHVKLKVSHF